MIKLILSILFACILVSSFVFAQQSHPASEVSSGTFQNNGNYTIPTYLGIGGNFNPNQLLEVRAIGRIQLTDPANPNRWIAFRNQAGGLDLSYNGSGTPLYISGYPGSGNLILWPNAGTGMVGIRNDNPQYDVDVTGNLHTLGTVYITGNLNTSGRLYIGPDIELRRLSSNYLYTPDTLGIGDALNVANNLNVVNGVYQKNGVSGTSPSCGANEVLKGMNVQGGIVTAGTCAPENVGTNYWIQSGLNLYPNNLGWNVGIGTANPQNKLHVVGSTANVVMIDSTGNNDLLGFYRDGVRKAVIGAQNIAGGNGFFIYHDPSASFPFFVSSTGNVGIGTINPQSELHVLSTGDQLRLGYNDVIYSTLSTDWTGRLTVTPGSSGTMMLFGQPNTQPSKIAFTIYDGATWYEAYVGYTDTTHRLMFGTNGVIRMALDDNDALSILGTGSGEGGQINLANAGITTPGQANAWTIDNAGNLRFFYSNTGVTPLQMDTSGRVGIGTNPSIQLALGDSDTGLQQAGDGILTFYTNGAERMRIDTFGNLLVDNIYGRTGALTLMPFNPSYYVQVGYGGSGNGRDLQVWGTTTLHSGLVTKEGDIVIQSRDSVAQREAQMYNDLGTLRIRSDLNADTDKLGIISLEAANVYRTGNAGTTNVIPSCKMYSALNSGGTTVDVRSCKNANPCHITLNGYYLIASDGYQQDLAEGTFVQEGNNWRSLYMKGGYSVEQKIGTQNDGDSNNDLISTDSHGTSNYCVVFDDYGEGNSADYVYLKGMWGGTAGTQMECYFVVCTTTGPMP